MAAKTSVPFFAPALYTHASRTDLQLQYVGRQLKDIAAPAAILDAAIVRRNCRLMLEATEKLDVEFRAHVKTHKTTEITQLQVGKTSTSVKLVCSTVSEIEHLLPWLLECKSHGRSVDVLYGLPLSPSQIPRLAAVARQLGPSTIGIFADHPAQIQAVDQVDDETWPGDVPVWINIDVGYHREGVSASSPQLKTIAQALQASPKTCLAGMYTHHGSSYASSSPEEALKYMATELRELMAGATAFLSHTGAKEGEKKVTLSLGASPTATAVQNLLHPTNPSSTTKYTTALEEAKQKFILEFHAGVYTLNDLQQLATHARPVHVPDHPDQTLLSHSDIAFRVLAEVASLYPDRGEALIAAGTIVLGREPCKSYEGWGVVTPWPDEAGRGYYDPEGEREGWIVGRVSQEHGLLSWEGAREGEKRLRVGEKLMVWPNHACIVGASFGWYVVVDSESDDAEMVRDVWLRWRGW